MRLRSIVQRVASLRGALEALRIVRVAAGPDLGVVLSAQLAAAIAGGGALLVGREILESMVSRGDSETLSSLAPELIGLGIALVCGSVSSTIQAERNRLIVQKVESHAMAEVAIAASRASYEDFHTPAFHDSLHRALESAIERPWEFVDGLLAALRGVLAGAATAVVLAVIAPWVLVVVVVLSVPFMLLSRANSRLLVDYERSVTQLDRERYYVIRLLVSRHASAERSALDLAPSVRARYDLLSLSLLSDLARVVHTRTRRISAAHALFGVVGAGIIGGLVHGALSGSTTVENATIAVLALQQMISQTRAANAGAGALGECLLFLDEYQAFVREHDLPRTHVNGGKEEAAHFEQIELQNVGYVYPGSTEAALADVSVSIRAGESIAVVGRNGSGKTTLALLLTGVLAPSQGSVLWDGHDVRNDDRVRLRAASAILPQDFLKLELTVLDNITYGRPNRLPDMAAATRAARFSGAEQFIASLPDSYATRLSPEFVNGRELSQGQWQRLALARVLYRGAQLTVLDEPSSSLDAEGENQLLAALRTLEGDTTCITISHRPTTILAADRILVMDEGRLVDDGSHAELAARCASYRALLGRPIGVVGHDKQERR